MRSGTRWWTAAVVLAAASGASGADFRTPLRFFGVAIGPGIHARPCPGCGAGQAVPQVLPAAEQIPPPRAALRSADLARPHQSILIPTGRRTGG